MQEEATPINQAGSRAADGKREQSTIAFPYLDLDAAVDVATAVYNRSGLGVCELDELAAEMNQTMSGAFRLKTGAARVFELVEREGKSGIKLSELGRQIVSPETERAARVEAFMRVPLYAAVFEKYRGHLLPPMKALEREMVSLGVASKQADKARQAFERSARQAGYYESGDDRLVRPKTDLPTRQVDQGENGTTQGADELGDNHSDGSLGEAGGSSRRYHHFIEGLLSELPESNDFASWPIRDQAEWLSAAASIFKLLSKSKGRIVVNVDSHNEDGGPN